MAAEQFPTLQAIEAAAARIAGAVTMTPCLASETLAQLTGCRPWLKFENLQFTASFKERGALNKLLLLKRGERAAGVCAMSAGNHAQGLAYHAARLGVPATIVMPRNTPLTKVSRTRGHGARVILEGANLSESLAVAQHLATEQGFAFVHPFDDPGVIEGQGTLGLELLTQVTDLDAVVVPIGGGGLISGIAIAIKAKNPGIRVIGVQSKTYPSMVEALGRGSPVTADGMTIAEGIAVKTAGHLTRQIVGDLVDDILLVGEASIERAIALLQSVEKTVVEGAGAAALAAVIENPGLFSGLNVALPLTGGNIDPRVYANVILRDLVRQGQLLHIEVPISDQPGALAELATVLGKEGANIVDMSHERLNLALNPRGAAIGLVIELQDESHGKRVLAGLAERGFTPVPRQVG
jgi:threonine dehydratase